MNLIEINGLQGGLENSLMRSYSLIEYFVKKAVELVDRLTQSRKKNRFVCHVCLLL
jgi:hypothetical protein